MSLAHALTRRKPLTTVLTESSELARVLSIFDLITLGVGATLGVGVYVLPGIIAKDVAGPGVVLSFFYAAVASVLSGLCYAEFGARVPRSGSAYVYSYITVGEFVAFIIGWNLIIEYVIGAASVARGVSLYLDSLFSNAMSDYFRSICTIEVHFLSDYIDFFALLISLLVCVGLAVGLKESMIVNNLLTTVNCFVVLFVILVGGIYADTMNWSIPASKVPVGYGSGGFLPYGFAGTLKGAATAFYGFVGFDIISTSGEEARNPSRAIPVSIIVSLFIIFLAYAGVSSVLTLMWPYFLQDVEAPIPYAFAEIDLNWAKWVVTIGAMFGLSASLFGGMFPLPRVIYAMSQDGLLFQFLGRVHPKYKTPFIGTILSGVVTGVMAAIFPLKNLVDLMSMATLACYTMVAMSVLILRYGEQEDSVRLDESSPLLGLKGTTEQSPRKSVFSNIPLMVYSLTVFCGLLAASIVHVLNLPPGSDLALWPFICFQLLLLISLPVFCFREKPSASSTFQMPGLPWTPILSIFFNLYLMCLMDLTTWIHFILWLAAGLLIYFGYGLKHSKENATSTGSYAPISSTNDF